MSEREEDPERLADQREHEVDQLSRHSRELGQDIKHVREDWQRKRADEGVPGAVPETEDDPGNAEADCDSPDPG